MNWEEPDVSETDTLIGYNIYQDDYRWRFQTNRSVACYGLEPSCPDAGLIFYENDAFWITVRAVYNSDSLESEVTDSAYFPGLAIEINQINYEKPDIYPNPVVDLLYSDIQNVVYVELFSTTGKLIARQTQMPIDLGSHPAGLYFIRIVTDEGSVVRKVLKK